MDTVPCNPGAKWTTGVLADGYLVSLLSYSLETLSHEPSNLRSHENALQHELREAAVKHYSGFIEAASCFHGISGQAQQVKAELKPLAESLAGLHSRTSEFKTLAQSYQVRFWFPGSSCRRVLRT